MNPMTSAEPTNVSASSSEGRRAGDDAQAVTASTPAASVDEGGRDRPQTVATDGPTRQRSRLAQPISDTDIATYAAGRAFLAGEWFGATLMVASFTFLYVLDFGTQASIATIYAICAGSLALGTLAFLRSRTYYERLGADLAPRLHVIAAVVAGSAGIFWLLFVLLVTLAWLGVPLQ